MVCRLYLNQELQVGNTITLPDDQAHYLRQVMRLQAGDQIILFNGRGGEYSSQIEQLSKARSSCKIYSFEGISREMECRIEIIQAACRSEKIETVLQKGTELGAAGFHIVQSERSSLRLDGNRLEKRLQRWRKIIAEAAEQSSRTMVPELAWHDSLSSISGNGLCLVLHPDSAEQWPAMRPRIEQATSIRLAIGPEGGWSPRDLEQFAGLGFSVMGFGPRVMRTETAAPALLAAIQAVQA